MRSIREAEREILAAFAPLELERIDLNEALGRCLAEDVHARSDAPPFSQSAMDGYAVAAKSLDGGGTIALQLEGESRAGATTIPVVTSGTVRIFTGAPLPPGADTVVMQEDVTTEGERVLFSSRPKLGAHVRARGEDLRAGEVILPRGARLGPGEIGLLASQSHAQVTVHRAPVVAILSSGDELRELGEPERPFSIVGSNAYALAAQVREAGAIPRVLPNARDDLDVLTRTVLAGLRADVLVTSGGVSVGAYDLLHDAFARAGVDPAFWKVRMKPGKPLTFGKRGQTPVLGLPGNPMSAMVTFELFVRPGLRAMLGDPGPFRRFIDVRLGAPIRHSHGRVELARGRLDLERGLAFAHAKQGSGSLSSFAATDALLVLPEDAGDLAEGAPVRALLLTDSLGSSRSAFA